MDELVIRPARLADTPSIGAMWADLVAYHRDLDSALPDAVAEGAQLYARRIADRLEDTQSQTLVAVHDGEVVGFVLGFVIDMAPEMFLPQTAGFLADIYVRPAMREQGVGRRLVAALGNWFQDRGIRHMELYVADRNLRGRAFWESLGGRDMMRRVRVPLDKPNSDVPPEGVPDDNN